MRHFYPATLFLFLFSCPMVAQDLETSHLVWNISTYNQGGLTGNNFAHFTYDYQQSVLSGNIKYSSSLFWMDYPILQNGVNTGAFYFSLENQLSGSDNKFKSFKSNAGLSKKIPINRQSFLSFGLGAEYQQQTLSLDNLTTGSQFIQGMGFNRSLENGESSSFYRATFFAINSGLFLFAKDPRQTQQMILGLSVNNINKPLKNWEGISTTQLALWCAQFQYLTFTNPKIALGPDGFFFKEGNTFAATGGATLRWYLGQSLSASFDEDYDQQYLTIFARLSTQSKATIGIQYRQENYVAGISGDVPFGQLNQHYRNGFEVFFSYNPRINGKTKNKKEKARKESSLPEKTSSPVSKEKPVKKDSVASPGAVLENSSSTDDRNKTQNQSDITQTESKIHAGEIISDHILPSKSFTPVYFIFNSSELDENSKKYLKELYEKILLNGAAKIELIGHTDNIGTEESNQELSVKRAEVVKRFLMDLGIKGANIIVTGKGENEPIVPNTTLEDRAKNRRVEVKIMEE